MAQPRKQTQHHATLAQMAIKSCLVGLLFLLMGAYQKPSDAELHKKLTPLQYEITQKDATEPPFQNAYWDNHEEGLYVDVTTGEPLFSSRDKFDSGTGWPSFVKPIDARSITTRTDSKLGIPRTEVRSKIGNAHLGHVFNDGPKPTGLRYCMNSAALRFIPVSQLKAKGYDKYAALFKSPAKPIPPDAQNQCAVPTTGQAARCSPTVEIAILAGGCFWGMEEILRKIPGVIDTEVGYTGGTTAKPTYEQVHQGTTGHAEAVRITFDPNKLSYADLLSKWFFKMHDPTTLNQQGNDKGSQYRSAIFYMLEGQKITAEAIKSKVKGAVTQIVKAGPFTKAEEYHQDYLQKNPNGYTCHYLRP